MTGAQAAITQPLNIAFYTQHISLNNRTQRAQIAPLIVINGIWGFVVSVTMRTVNV